MEYNLSCTVKSTGGVKHDSGKPRLDLLPFDALEEVSKALNYGASKYETHNWRKGFDYSRLIGATLRHIGAWQNGQDLDEESGVSHLAHAATNLLFLIALQKEGNGKDDRYKVKTSSKNAK